MTKQEEIEKGMGNIIRERQPSLAQSYGNAKDSNLFIGATVRMLIEYQDSQGVVIKVEGELPDSMPALCVVNLVEGRGYPNCMAGYVAVEPLIEEK